MCSQLKLARKRRKYFRSIIVTLLPVRSKNNNVCHDKKTTETVPNFIDRFSVLAIQLECKTKHRFMVTKLPEKLQVKCQERQLNEQVLSHWISFVVMHVPLIDVVKKMLQDTWIIHLLLLFLLLLLYHPHQIAQRS